MQNELVAVTPMFSDSVNDQLTHAWVNCMSAEEAADVLSMTLEHVTNVYNQLDEDMGALA